MTAKTMMAWSGGKDAAFCLYRLRSQLSTVPTSLYTTINPSVDRSTMHGVRRSLYIEQAAAIDLPIEFIELEEDTSNETYRELMDASFTRWVADGFESVAYADIALTDVRDFRRSLHDDSDISCRFPIWGEDTTELARAIIDAGFSAIVVTVSDAKLDASFVGRRFDRSFLCDLPEDVDPCGENGEFHTFVVDGPIFDRPISVETGETVTRPAGSTEYHYLDLSH